MKKILYLAVLLAVVSCTKESDVIPQPVIGGQYKATGTSLLPNSGGLGATDWDITSKILVPDGWKLNSYGRYTQDEGVWWTGVFARVHSKSQFIFDSPAVPVESAWHTLTFKYRSNTDVRLAVKYSPACTYCICIIPASDKVQLFTVQFWSPEIRFLRFYNSPVKPGYIELDEINLYDSN